MNSYTHFLISIIFLATFQFINAQNYSFKYSEPINDVTEFFNQGLTENHSHKTIRLKTIDSTYYRLYKEDKSIYLSKINLSNPNLRDTTLIIQDTKEKKFEDDRYKIYNVIITKDSILYFTEQKTKKTKEFYLQVFSTNGKELSEKKKIFDVPLEDNSDNFSSFFFTDSDQLAIASSPESSNKSLEEKTYYLFDKRLNLSSKNVIQYKKTNNNSIVFMSSTKIINNQIQLLIVDKYDWLSNECKLIFLTQTVGNPNSTKQTLLTQINERIDYPDQFYDNEGNLIIFGLTFKLEKRKDVCYGYRISKISPDGKILYNKIINFDLATKKLFDTGKEDPHFRLLYSGENNKGYYYVLEKKKESYAHLPAYKGTTKTYNSASSSNDILVIPLTLNGDINGTVLDIPKKQKTDPNSPYAGCKVFGSNTSLYFCFLDDMRNTGNNFEHDLPKQVYMTNAIFQLNLSDHSFKTDRLKEDYIMMPQFIFYGGENRGLFYMIERVDESTGRFASMKKIKFKIAVFNYK